MVVAKSGIPMGPFTACRIIWLRTTPTSAPMRVTNIAASDRNSRVSRTIAIATPTSSPTGASCWAARSATSPRVSTLTPSPSPAWAAFSNALPSAVSMSIDCLSNWTVVKAVRPSLDTAPPSARGSGTPDTSGSFCSAAIDLATWALLAGSLSLPESVVKTTWLCAPAAEGNFVCRRSIAFWDSVPGIEKSCAALPLCEPMMAPTTTTVRTRPARPRFQ